MWNTVSILRKKRPRENLIFENLRGRCTSMGSVPLFSPGNRVEGDSLTGEKLVVQDRNKSNGGIQNI